MYVRLKDDPTWCSIGRENLKEVRDQGLECRDAEILENIAEERVKAWARCQWSRNSGRTRCDGWVRGGQSGEGRGRTCAWRYRVGQVWWPEWDTHLLLRRQKALNPEPHFLRWWSTEMPQGNNPGCRGPGSPASPGAVTSSQYLLLGYEWLPSHSFKEIWSLFIYFYIWDVDSQGWMWVWDSPTSHPLSTRKVRV